MKKKLLPLLFVLLIPLLVAVMIYSGPNSSDISANLSNAKELLFPTKQEESIPEPDSEPESIVIEESNEESEEESYTDSVPEYWDESRNSGEIIELTVNVFTSEADLYVSVRDSYGGILKETFEISISAKNYNKTYVTSENGIIYINELSGGNYKVTVKSKEGYIAPAPIECEVKGGVEKKPIENIKDKITVHITTPGNNYEITGLRDTDVDQGTVEEITNDDIGDYHKETVPEGNSIENDSVYEYQLGPYGFLVRSSDNKESDVKPIFINGLLAYGERENYTLVEGTEDQYIITKERVELFAANGDPLSQFKISYVYVPPAVLTGWQTVDGKTYYYDSNGNKVTGYAKINNKHYYFDASGVKASAMIIDVSEWQTVKSWASVKAAGIEGVIVRIGGRGYGSGSIYSDDNALTYLKQAKAAGLKVGIYFFSAAINATEAVEEASWALDVLGGMKLDYPIYIDMEHSGDYPNGRADRLSAAQHTSIATAFCDTVISAGYKAGVYASYYYLRDELNFSTIKKYDIWLANYTTGYKMTTFPYSYDLWQFTPKAKIDGISGNVDLNVRF